MSETHLRPPNTIECKLCGEWVDADSAYVYKPKHVRNTITLHPGYICEFCEQKRRELTHE